VHDSPIILLCLLVLPRVEPGGAALGAISVCGALFVAWMGVEGLRARPPDPVKAWAGRTPCSRAWPPIF
jgi:threonine/homoserine/homoserine lactone efflux protein